MDKNQDIVNRVRDWYGSPKHWLSSGKSTRCVDWQLIGETGQEIKDKSVLNVGCFYPGDEIHFGKLAKRWVAIDFCPEVIEWSKNLLIPNVEFYVQDARHLDFPDSIFEVVLDFSSGDQMPEDHYDEVLKEIYRVLQPKGIFAVTFADYNVFHKKEVFGECGYSRIYSSQELKDKIVPIGYSVKKELSDGIARAGLLFEKC